MKCTVFNWIHRYYIYIYNCGNISTIWMWTLEFGNEIGLRSKRVWTLSVKAFWDWSKTVGSILLREWSCILYSLNWATRPMSDRKLRVWIKEIKIENRGGMQWLLYGGCIKYMLSYAVSTAVVEMRTSFCTHLRFRNIFIDIGNNMLPPQCRINQ